jgi:hypothetical protein
MHKAVIMGVGPDRGLGAQLCKRFAKEELHQPIRHAPASEFEPRHVAILAYPGVALLDAVGPLEVFAAANLVLAERSPRNAPVFAELADSFIQFMGDGIFVAHSVKFRLRLHLLRV